MGSHRRAAQQQKPHPPYGAPTSGSGDIAHSVQGMKRLQRPNLATHGQASLRPRTCSCWWVDPVRTQGLLKALEGLAGIYTGSITTSTSSGTIREKACFPAVEPILMSCHRPPTAGALQRCVVVHAHCPQKDMQAPPQPPMLSKPFACACSHPIFES
jgi:hypothetical protein